MSKYVELALGAICSPESPLRVSIDEAGIHELGLSIREVGLLQPLVVRPVAAGFEVVAGHRRLLACRLIGLDRVPCTVLEATDDTNAVASLAENVLRRDLSAVEEARAIEKMRTVLGMSVRAIADRMGKSDAWVRGRLDLLTWPLAALEAVARGRATMAALAPLVDIEQAEERDRLIECAVDSGATASVTRTWAAGLAGEAAAAEGTTSARATAAMPMAEYVVSMPCFACRLIQPALDLRFIRICDACLAIVGDGNDPAAGYHVVVGEPPEASGPTGPEVPAEQPGRLPDEEQG